ncbi:membrane protein [Arthrobacter phage Atuin]|nr:membrane protein [Arthrobacter phage Atuin]
MGTDVISVLATIALFILGIWIILSFTALLLDLLGYALCIVAVVWFLRWVRSRGA